VGQRGFLRFLQGHSQEWLCYRWGRWRLSHLLLFLVAALVSLASPARCEPASAQASSSHHARRKTGRKKPAYRLDVSKINDPRLTVLVARGSKGNGVARAAILLDRLRFSPGEIADVYSENLGNAISAFQSASGLAATGAVDQATWAALNDDQLGGQVETQAQPGEGSSPAHAQASAQAQAQARGPAQNLPSAITTYMITREDVAGPFTRLPRGQGEREMLLEAKLPRLDYGSPWELLAEKFHTNEQLLAQLNRGKRFDKEGESIEVPNVLTPAPPEAASVVVDGLTRSVEALDANGNVLAFFPATVGSEHDPLPVGIWKITGKKWYPKFKYNPNLFWDAEDKRPRATIAPGPKNPVGVVWIGLSIAHYGIHGTPTPSLIGRTESHGCIRLTNWDAAELARMVRPGTPAILEERTPWVAKSQSASSR
jgi:lipoprotein-anchoring transpeptidase ErfK/SrfK